MITPHLTVRGVEEAARFYERAFGFRRRLMLPGGSANKVQHAEVELGACKVMIGPESPQRGMLAPISTGKPPPVSLYLDVANVDAAHAKAVAAGAIELLPPSDQFFGARTSVVADPDGHQWMLAQQKQDMTEDQMREAMQSEPNSGAAHSVPASANTTARRRTFSTK